MTTSFTKLLNESSFQGEEQDDILNKSIKKFQSNKSRLLIDPSE